MRKKQTQKISNEEFTILWFYFISLYFISQWTSVSIGLFIYLFILFYFILASISHLFSSLSFGPIYLCREMGRARWQRQAVAIISGPGSRNDIFIQYATISSFGKDTIYKRSMVCATCYTMYVIWHTYYDMHVMRYDSFVSLLNWELLWLLYRL